MRRSRFVVAAVVVGALAATVAIVFAVEESKQTRECTIESLRTVAVYKSADYTRVYTVECGDIAAPLQVNVESTRPDCPFDLARVGGLYLMTTTGYDAWPFDQRLVGTMVLVEPAPGAECHSDFWLNIL